MLDIKKIIENYERYIQDCKKRNFPIEKVEEVISLRKEKNKLQNEIDNKKAEQKKAGKEKNIELAKKLKDEIKNLEEKYEEIKKKFDEKILYLPNFLHSSTPQGKDDTENVEIERIGEIPSFNFKIKDHMELMKLHNMIDVEASSKISGTRFYYLKNYGAILQDAVLKYAIDFMLSKNYEYFSVPHLVNTEYLYGTGYLPGGEEDSYYLEKDQKWLIATAEIPLTAYHSNEILDYKDLPKKYFALSPSYRREAGSYGKDTYGLYRVHQFYKVEQFVLVEADEKLAEKLYYEILENAKEFVKSLNLPFRVIQLCSGDMARGKYLSHDIETWMPSRNSYGETHSATLFLDFQARRLKIRYRDKDGNIKYAYTMNNTLVASPRFLIPLIENNQTPEGKIKIPEVLVKYVGKEILG